MRKLRPFKKGPIQAVIAGDCEELQLFGYAAIRRGADRFYRGPEADAPMEPLDENAMSFGWEIRALLAMRVADERERQEKMGVALSRWRLLLSPRLAALLAFRLFLDLSEVDRITSGVFDGARVEWARFPSHVVLQEWGIREVEVSPAHIGLSFEKLSD